jgi:hypothetical protein
VPNDPGESDPFAVPAGVGFAARDRERIVYGADGVEDEVGRPAAVDADGALEAIRSCESSFV